MFPLIYLLLSCAGLYRLKLIVNQGPEPVREVNGKEQKS
jgi:hypothetical protein